ncbi:MAG: nucleotidyl transferase AbiEii/AbiGii toxin family protein [Bacteroidetes bacterium]|nr:nucleotidyl transferase AbiEii/AbiGii toxin family protein [Bacteroidota bacterium]
MVEFLILPEERRRLYIQQVSIETGMSEKAVEKDWWVTLVLKAVFALPMARHFVFKGGTSLSKGWKLIERLSEDIDIAMAPEAFDMAYKNAPSHSYVKQLKREGAIYTSLTISEAMHAQLRKMGVPEQLFSISVEIIKPILPDKDPQTVFVHYTSLYEANAYLADSVKVELGVRSLKEPFAEVAILSEVGKYIRISSYAENPFVVRAVVPEKTMIYGEAPDFDTIIAELKQLNEQFQTFNS